MEKETEVYHVLLTFKNRTDFYNAIRLLELPPKSKKVFSDNGSFRIECYVHEGLLLVFEELNAAIKSLDGKWVQLTPLEKKLKDFDY